MTTGEGDFGVYVHVPFCASRCDYCAFATWTDRHHLMERYTAACAAELAQATAEGELRPATSAFFGGGTPSQLPGGLLGALLESIDLAEGAEVTAECNPEDASASLFDHWRRAGVTRVSFGVQSMVPHVLESLGRATRPAHVRRALALAAGAGIENLSVDLIFGAAGESDEDWERTLGEVLALDPAPVHISAYALTVEAGTPLAADVARYPDDDVQARRYELTERVLSAAGYQWYEISNWARPGRQCRHNQLYWAQGDYRGIGCAAHSHASGRRYWNIRSVDRYIDRISSGLGVVAGEEFLDQDQREFERLALALRTAEGVPSDFIGDEPELDRLVSRAGGRAVLTVRGRLLGNSVTAHLRVPTILPACCVLKTGPAQRVRVPPG